MGAIVSTLSAAGAGSATCGRRQPSFQLVPDGDPGLGDDAVELAAVAGIELDPWEADVVRGLMRVRPNGLWAAPEGGLEVPRQNGKGEILLTRELAETALVQSELVTHTAHEFPTSLEHFRRMEIAIETSPDLDREVLSIRRSHGEEGIDFRGGRRVRFRTRTAKGGRGFTGDLLVLDEAMYLPDRAFGTLMPTLSAVPNPQIIYSGSAVDLQEHEHGLVFARIRENAMKGRPLLAFFEWAVRGDLEDLGAELDDVAAWAAANPAFGIRISEESIRRERGSMSERAFAVERLGIGDWPRTDVPERGEITLEMWDRCADPTSQVLQPLCLAFDVRPSRGNGAISAAGMRRDELSHVETVAHRRGVAWIPDRLVQLVAKHKPVAIVYDAGSPAASLVRQLEKRLLDERLDVEIVAVNTREFAQVCGAMFDAVDERTVRHLGTPELTTAIKAARRRPIADAWAWSRKQSRGDISPLVAGALAMWGLMGPAEQRSTLTADDYRIGAL